VYVDGCRVPNRRRNYLNSTVDSQYNNFGILVVFSAMRIVMNGSPINLDILRVVEYGKCFYTFIGQNSMNAGRLTGDCCRCSIGQNKIMLLPTIYKRML
jgi:hypothetical protein